jgi:aryl-alcohol dehydrogenase-like predicted oxidoreductase
MRTLGNDRLAVSTIGLGCGSFHASTPADHSSDVAVIHAALDNGINFLDTADMYGPSEEIVGAAIRGRREDVIVATKFGQPLDPSRPDHRKVDGRPEYARAAVYRSLARLGSDYIDLYYLHRVDPLVPIEETVGAMADFVKAGMVRHLGLCEPGRNTLRRAHATHPITAIQSEWSLFARDIEDETVPLARELGIGLVPYAPLARGMLSGAITQRSQIVGPMREHPRYRDDVFDHNVSLVDAVRRVAARRDCGVSQVALAWIVGQGPDVAPIPGTRHLRYLEDNIGAMQVRLDAEDLAELETLSAAVKGHRSFFPAQIGTEAPPAR